jgi:hypothetical protein
LPADDIIDKDNAAASFKLNFNPRAAAASRFTPRNDRAALRAKQAKCEVGTLTNL